MNASVESIRTLTYKEWTAKAAAHRERLAPYVEQHLLSRTHGLKHPVYDFLFSYYSFSSGQLLRWSPGIKVYLQGDGDCTLDWPDHTSFKESCYRIDTELFPQRRLPYLQWAIRFLRNTYERPPVFHCFGLHEWAMLYKTTDSRHPELALRVSATELERTVEAAQVRCTHYDAFRFFSSEARPLNRFQLEREEVTEHDQPACIHANMDLYRMAYKVAPFVPSELIADLFLLAREARELDMKASPYDLGAFDVSPIPIETRAGRETYVVAQRALFEKAQPYRQQLLSAYQTLLQCLNSPGLADTYCMAAH